MKKIVSIFLLSNLLITFYHAQDPRFPNRGCGTKTPEQQWEAKFQELVQQYIQQHPEALDNITGRVINNSSNQIQNNYTIPVIIHVIHGGQAVGTYPNLAYGQLTSQIQVLNDDYSGNGYNVSTYPANAFVNYAASLPAANKDGSGRVKIANTGIQFCLATKDTLGNILPEPGVERINYNNLPALTGTFTSKNPAASVYNNPTKFQDFIDNYIKKNTIWNVSKYLNIWVTDENSSVGLLGYATFPYLSGLTGISSTGTSQTDGFWCWAKSFGSINIFPSGTYDATYKYGRTCSHEIGHYLGLRHTWGDGTCATDYCNDTPPEQTANYNCGTYPYQAGTCSGNSPDGIMWMNFMDYSPDNCMYMFTVDQTTRIQTAMANSPYRKFLGTHGLCGSSPTLTVSFSSPSVACAGSAVTMTNTSNGSPTPTYTWVVTPTTGVSFNPNANATNPSITFPSGGTYTIALSASNGTTGIATKTILISQPNATITSSNVSCNGGNNGSATLTTSGGTSPYSYTWSPSGGNAATANNLTAGNYTVTIKDANNCTSSKTLNISQPSAISANISVSNVSCNCGNNGSATVTASGGISPYSYTWSPSGGNAATANNLTAGNYTVTIKDANNCTSSKTLNISQPSAISANISVSNVSCNGGNNGSATVTASGGTSPYSYTWSPSGGNAATANNLTAGNYTVTIKDAKNCIYTKTTTISQPAPINTSVSINGNTLTAVQSGASYQWVNCTNAYAPIPGATSQSYYTTAGGSYAVIITIGGCSDTSNCQITTYISEINGERNIVIYPNPARENITISGLKSTDELLMYDAIGHLILKKNASENTETIDVINFESGVYIFMIRNENTHIQKKLIINK